MIDAQSLVRYRFVADIQVIYKDKWGATHDATRHIFS